MTEKQIKRIVKPIVYTIYYIIHGPLDICHWFWFQWNFKVLIPYRLRQLSKLERAYKEKQHAERN